MTKLIGVVSKRSPREDKQVGIQDKDTQVVGYPTGTYYFSKMGPG